MISEDKQVYIKLILYISLLVLMIAIFLSIIIKYYIGFSEYEYIWFCSKILTIKKIIRKNNKDDKIYHHIDSQFRKYIIGNDNFNYLDLLKNMPKEGDPTNYKKCGIFDTYGNNFFLSKSSDCPMNDIIYDSSSRTSEYQNNGYEQYCFANDYNLCFYFKYGVENKGIIVNWITSNSRPKYINENNFVLDKDAFEEIFNSFDSDDDDDDDDDDYDDNDDDDDVESALGKALIEGSVDTITNLISDGSKIEKLNKLIDYIDDKINNDEKNIDYNYTYVNYNNYVKNFIGFKDYENAKDFDKIDFSIYKSRYPNYVSMIFAAILLSFFTIILILIIIFIIKDKDIHRIFIISLILYIPSFLGFWIYSIVIYAKYFKNESIDIAKGIGADKFIEDFLKEFYESFEKNSFILVIIILLSFSALLYISIFVIIPIFNCIEKRQNNSKREVNYRNYNQRQNMNNNININNNQPQLITQTIQINSNRQLNENRNQNLNNNRPQLTGDNMRELDVNSIQNEKNENNN